MRRYHDPYLREYPMGPEWGRPHPLDPNWRDGEYHGMRMEYSHRHGAYGFHRRTHEDDLLGYGGFDGLYDEGPGAFDREGMYRHPYFRGRVTHGHSGHVTHAGYDAEFRHVEDGGVRGDVRYLRQYNAESPMLRGGRYDRGYGWAPAGPGEGGLTRPDLRRAHIDEQRYAGYNTGGFAPQEQGMPGLDRRK